jgi:hypothetical protein
MVWPFATPRQPSGAEAVLLQLREHVANAGGSALGRRLTHDEANQAMGSLAALTAALPAGGLWAVVARRRRRRAAAEAEHLAAARAGGVFGSTVSAAAAIAGTLALPPPHSRLQPDRSAWHCARAMQFRMSRRALRCRWLRRREGGASPETGPGNGAGAGRKARRAGGR